MNTEVETSELRVLTTAELETVSGAVLPFFVAGLAVGVAIGCLSVPEIADEIIKPVPGLVYN